MVKREPPLLLPGRFEPEDQGSLFPDPKN